MGAAGGAAASPTLAAVVERSAGEELTPVRWQLQALHPGHHDAAGGWPRRASLRRAAYHSAICIRWSRAVGQLGGIAGDSAAICARAPHKHAALAVAVAGQPAVSQRVGVA